MQILSVDNSMKKIGCEEIWGGRTQRMQQLEENVLKGEAVRFLRMFNS